jgi:hypothetical protein
MHTQSVAFAKRLKSVFGHESASAPFTEVGQFRALIRAFAGLKPHFYLEEFHGFKRQVYFDTSLAWQRKRARCELCDVLLIVYTTNGGFDVRMTLLQAKLSREKHIVGLTTSAGRIERQAFKANFEQWSLLCERPVLIPTTVFDPPPDLLSGALLPSVGTFGVFHRLTSGLVDLFYICADCLEPASRPVKADTRFGKLITKYGNPDQRFAGSWNEVTYCSTIFDFARSLYELSIGTPVLHVSGVERTEYQPQYNRVRSVLTAHIEATDRDAIVARNLLENLEMKQDSPRLDKVPTLIVLRSEAKLNKLTR